MKSNMLVMVILVVVVGVGSFFAGTKYQQSKRPQWGDMPSAGMHTGMAGQRGAPGIRRGDGQGMVNGEIISRDETSITVKLPDDSTKIVLISENTAINKATEGSVGDLETGEQVMVFGKANSDGSISASQIQLP